MSFLRLPLLGVTVSSCGHRALAVQQALQEVFVKTSWDISIWIAGVYPLTLVTQWPHLGCKRPPAWSRNRSHFRQNLEATSTKWLLVLGEPHTRDTCTLLWCLTHTLLGTMLTLSMAHSICLHPTWAPSLSPPGLTGLLCSACLPVTSPHWAAAHHKLWCGPQLLTPGEVPGQGGSGVAPGWQNTGCLYSPATPRWKPNKSRAWAALYVPPSSRRPGTLWSCSPWSPSELWDRSK